MEIEFDMSGMQELRKKLEELDGEHQVPFEEMLTDKFISDNTNYSSLQEMLEKSCIKIESTDDLEDIPDNQRDDFIRQNTTFDIWDEMLSKAWEEWIKHKLGL